MSRNQFSSERVQAEVKTIELGGTSRGKVQRLVKDLGIFESIQINTPNGVAGYDANGKVNIDYLPTLSAPSASITDPLCIMTPAYKNQPIICKIMNYATNKPYVINAVNANVHLFSFDDYLYFNEKYYNEGQSFVPVRVYKNYDNNGLYSTFGGAFKDYINYTNGGRDLGPGSLIILPTVSEGEITLTINGRDITIPILGEVVTKPTFTNIYSGIQILKPTIDNGGFTIYSDAFASPLPDNLHNASNWEIALASDPTANLFVTDPYQQIQYSEQDFNSLWLRNFNVTGDFIVRVRYMSSYGFSEWSDPCLISIIDNPPSGGGGGGVPA